MKKIIVAAHGEVAEYLLDAARSLTGNIEGVFALNFGLHQSLSYLKNAIRVVIEDAEEDVFILTDFPGGSPCNCACAFLVRPGVRVISGVNLPLLLELIVKRDKLPADKAVEAAVTAGRNSIADVGEEFSSRFCRTDNGKVDK